jgi:diaminopimelate epimerase
VGLISVTKCHGTGNDFIILDVRGAADRSYPSIARTLCQRRFSMGADGLLVLGDPHVANADASMRIFNADGSEAEMCGNGIRCIARYLFEENPERTERSIETVSGLVETKIVTWEGAPGVRVAMGEPTFTGGSPGKTDNSLVLDGESAPAYAVSIGNPHVVVFVKRDPAKLHLKGIATTIAGWKIFDSEPNVEIVNVTKDGIQMRVQERGVGETWACGSGACAAAAAAIASGRTTSPVKVTTKGGSVDVAWQGPGQPVQLTGNAELVFRTDVDVPVAR